VSVARLQPVDAIGEESATPPVDIVAKAQLRVFVVSLFATIPLVAQPPQFEVATIKQNKSGERLSGAQRQPGGRLTITNMTLRTLITFAYQNGDIHSAILPR